jgi:hypothetical protein
LTDYYKALAERKIPQLLKKYNIDIVVGDLSQGDAYRDLFYSSAWAPVYIGGHYFVAIPRERAKENIIPILDLIDPFSNSQAKVGREADALKFYMEQSQSKDATVDDKLRYAYALFYLKKYDDTINILTKIKASQAPGNVLFNMGKDYLIALSYSKKGDCSDFKNYLDITNQGIKGVMFLTPWKSMPSPVKSGYLLYTENCPT